MGLVLSSPILATVTALVIAHVVPCIFIYAIIISLDSRLQQLDRIQCVLISTQEWNVPYPDIRQSFSKFYNYSAYIVKECSKAVVKARRKEEAICRRGPHRSWLKRATIDDEVTRLNFILLQRDIGIDKNR
ncbi:hypothetical protein V1477_000854 [Vespula maculifrons]|uniref:Uncharacterized protein n=1 Tax=Vespula maculifrons TaxID=7453 RepID=A0ABD2D0C6_VESMC